MIALDDHGEKRRNFKDAGRACPIDYHIDQGIFAADPDLHCNTLYVVGGLYGNPFALDAIERMAAVEAEAPAIVLNGDIHWFDKTADNFWTIEQRVKHHIPLVGNVEAELRRQEDVGVGCGCAYPDCNSDAAVSRSNRIHKMLSIAVEERPECKEILQGRPCAMVVDVAGVKVGITHGDEKLIGGWDCSRDSLQDPTRVDELSRWMAKNGIEVFTSTHTCAAVAMQLPDGLFINNGAAGLPNFEGEHFGTMVRIATTPAPEAQFTACWKGLYVEAVPVRYDHEAYLAWFDALWPHRSPAEVSYRSRIVNGPAERISEVLFGGFEVGEAFKGAPEVTDVRVKGASADTVDDVFAKLMYFDDMLEPYQLRTNGEPKSMQVNVGKLCNLACLHCHVEAGPHRSELMSRECMEAVLAVMADHGMTTLDITGGAPEMNPHFEWLIEQAAAAGYRTMVRSNLVILREPGYTHLPAKFAELGVEVVASLPSLIAGQMEAQRGKDTFDPSIDVLRELNKLGYGWDSTHVLDLVYNPQTPYLCPEQDRLEAMYKQRLEDTYGIKFDNLFAIANCPIGRYGVHLARTGDLKAYMDLLMDAFNPDAAQRMMCRNQISVGWDGRIYDCDFNQADAVDLPQMEGERALTIFDYAHDPGRTTERAIVFGNHCYACTAGQGSSCEGTLVQSA
ncbi:MAG: arsenosugar biosynthesis radical SAM protein ArsS [Eggerthellaceae bacterium]|nr:arsenosugar biosynthesis radical SAM protein ArsS [Eggerthellaceae bacterium]